MKILQAIAATILCIGATSIHAQNFNFDGYALGSIDGQDGWTGNADTNVAQVVAAPAGMSGQALLLPGSDTQKMDNFISRSYVGTPTSISFDMFLSDSNTPVPNPVEVFIRFNSWTSRIEIKQTAGEINVLAGGSISQALPIDTTFNLAVEYDVTGGNSTAAEVFLNGSSIGVVGGGVDMTAGPLIEFRSQNSETYIDNLSLVPEPSTYAALAGILALSLVLVRRQK